VAKVLPVLHALGSETVQSTDSDTADKGWHAPRLDVANRASYLYAE
jgi:hypothetical protein